MVSFLQKVSNYYVRDPRQQYQQPNPFYDSNYGSPTRGYNGVYNPTAYNPYNPSVGVSPGLQPRNSSLSASFLPTVGGYASNYSVPGLSASTGYSDTGILGKNNLISSLVNPVLEQTGLNRLINNNLPSGADYRNLYTNRDSYSSSSFNDKEETRVMVSDPSGKLINGAITSPLADTSGVIFPYTPTINIAHRANYDTEQLVHTNYDQLYYKNSNVDQITIGAKFTASDPDEAAYILAAMHFFRSATKMFYGSDSIAGTPPPVLRLDGYGKFMLDHLPVVCTSFDYSYPEDVDYIGANNNISTSGGDNSINKVPTQMQFNLGFKLVYSRTRLSNNFGLEKFASGQLLSIGKPGRGGPGGFI